MPLPTPRYLWRLVTTPRMVSSQLIDSWWHVRSARSIDAFARAYRIVRPYTMSGYARLHGLYRAVQDVTTRGVAGDIVECGTARGGSAALLGLAMKDSGVARTLWAFDTFAGIPPPTAADPDYDIAVRYTGSFRGEEAEVSALLERLGLLGGARLVKGCFEDTVPRCDVDTIAVLHLDGDWYESVTVCLDHLYDRVSTGGVIQIDDYGHWAGARRAVDEFLAKRGLAVELQHLDYTGRQFVKP